MKRVMILILAVFSATIIQAQKVQGVGTVDFNYVVSESKRGVQALAESKAFEQSLNDKLLPLCNEPLAMQKYFNAREGSLIAADFQLKSTAFASEARQSTMHCRVRSSVR